MKQFEFLYNNQTVKIWLYEDDDSISVSVQKNKTFYESEILEFLLKNFPVHEDIFDVGANIGNHTLFFSKFLSYNHIHSFEPHHLNFQILQKNTEDLNNCSIYPIALSDYIGSCSLTTETYTKVQLRRNLQPMFFKNMGMFGIKSKTGDIPVKTIDSLRTETRKITLLKIDVEEHEIEVLSGAYETITQDKPVLIIEAHESKREQYNKFLLEKFNYKCMKFWYIQDTGIYVYAKN